MKYEDVHAYRHGQLPWYKRLLMKRRHARNEDVAQAVQELDDLETKMVADSAPIDADKIAQSKKDILSAVEDISQEKKIVSQSRHAAKDTGTWIIARPLWQVGAAAAGVFYLAARRRKKDNDDSGAAGSD